VRLPQQLVPLGRREWDLPQDRLLLVLVPHPGLDLR